MISSSIGIEWNGLVYRDFTVRMPSHNGQFAQHGAPFARATTAEFEFGLLEHGGKCLGRTGAGDGDMWDILHFLAQEIFQHPAVKRIMQGNQGLGALSRHQQDEFIEQAFDVAEHHRQMRPFGDDAARVRCQLHHAQVAGKGKHQGDVRIDLAGEGIVAAAEGIDGDIFKLRKPDDSAARQGRVEREFADIAMACHAWPERAQPDFSSVFSSSTVLIFANAASSSSNCTSMTLRLEYHLSILRWPLSRKARRCGASSRLVRQNTGCAWSKVLATARSALLSSSAACRRGIKSSGRNGESQGAVATSGCDALLMPACSPASGPAKPSMASGTTRWPNCAYCARLRLALMMISSTFGPRRSSTYATIPLPRNSCRPLSTSPMREPRPPARMRAEIGAVIFMRAGPRWCCRRPCVRGR